jgi:hypothetical protein
MPFNQVAWPAACDTSSVMGHRFRLTTTFTERQYGNRVCSCVYTALLYISMSCPPSNRTFESRYRVLSLIGKPLIALTIVRWQRGFNRRNERHGSRCIKRTCSVAIQQWLIDSHGPFRQHANDPFISVTIVSPRKSLSPTPYRCIQ